MSIATLMRSRTAKIGLPLVAAGVFAAACSSGVSSGSASSGSAPTNVSSSSSASPATVMITGGHLTDATGRTLYLWVADSAGKSTCVGACASVWPPVPASGTPMAGPGVDAAKLTMIARSDGGEQIAYGGHPLYYFAGDKSAGQTTGQGNTGFGAAWWEVNAAGQAITSMTASGAPAASGGGNGY